MRAASFDEDTLETVEDVQKWLENNPGALIP